MPTTLRSRLLAVVAVTVLAAAAAQALGSRPLRGDPAALTGPATVASGGAGPVAGDTAVAESVPDRAAQQAAVRYWTPARMAAVIAADQGLPAAPGQSVPTQPAPAQPSARAQAAGQLEGPGRPAQTRELVRQAPVAAWLSGNSGSAGLRWTHGGAVAAAVGKVFFTLGGADYVCSATLAGPGRTAVVLTAAHCVSGGPGRTGTARWATNWVFVPGYRNGTMPAGEYTARRFFVLAQWAGPQGGTEQYDVAFVQLTAATLDGGGHAPVPAHGLPLRFASSQDGGVPPRAYVFGYPAEPPYSGLFANFCAGRAAAADGSVRTACGMTAGDSGGPWLAGFSPRAGTGAVFAVTTYKLSTSRRELYGAVLGPRAKALYARALSTAG
jgi:V8-like Glu-specific endopeptidase